MKKYLLGFVIAIIAIVLIVMATRGTTDLADPQIEPSLDSSPVAAKIDIQAVCNDALIYMTFIDGESANLFVSECIEGKHPEVIERFISDLGIDGAVI